MKAFSVAIAVLLCVAAAGGQLASPVEIAGTPMPPDVPGAPFSAEIASVTKNVLADGTHIDRETRAKFFRDGQGRTRHETESQPDHNGIRHVGIRIHDPVKGIWILLDTAHNIARIHRSAIGLWHGVLPIEPAMTERRESPLPRGSESLGTRMIDGFSVEGIRRIISTPAGRIGNDKPIVTVTEAWYSREVKANLLFTRSDPRIGQSTTKLENIQLGEPDPQLFQVPPGYEIEEMPSKSPQQRQTHPNAMSGGASPN